LKQLSKRVSKKKAAQWSKVNQGTKKKQTNKSSNDQIINETKKELIEQAKHVSNQCKKQASTLRTEISTRNKQEQVVNKCTKEASNDLIKKSRKQIYAWMYDICMCMHIWMYACMHVCMYAV
jgi:vacuolar-type H+-ATPase subunit H